MIRIEEKARQKLAEERQLGDSSYIKFEQDCQIILLSFTSQLIPINCQYNLRKLINKKYIITAYLSFGGW